MQAMKGVDGVAHPRAPVALSAQLVSSGLRPLASEEGIPQGFHEKKGSSHGQNLDVTVLCVPYSLNNG